MTTPDPSYVEQLDDLDDILAHANRPAEVITPDQVLTPQQGAMVRSRLALERLLGRVEGRTNRGHGC